MTPRITLRKLDTARKLILNNAADLIEESEILFKKRKYARSYALAHLAGEEMAKIFMVVGVGAKILKGERIDLRKFEKRFKYHPEKLMQIELFDFSHSLDIDFDFEEAERNIKRANYLKNLSLYVHYEGGNFVNPAQLIKRRSAQACLKLAKNRYKSLSHTESIVAKLTDINKNPKRKKRYLHLLNLIKSRKNDV